MKIMDAVKITTLQLVFTYSRFFFKQHFNFFDYSFVISKERSIIDWVIEEIIIFSIEIRRPEFDQFTPIQKRLQNSS